MSLTYTTQHYEWQQRVNKELFFAMKFDQFYKSKSKFSRNLPSLQRLLSPQITSRQSERSLLIKSREIAKRPSTRGSNFSKISKTSEKSVIKDEESMKTYIKELESQLKQEKMKRIKSEEVLKRYTSREKMQ
ncbi:hypothetical protein SteCoe_15524 [Stentor coeruleus]|uniref:Uncharacterized protein n=1 Tax=Stentor coeruleus TaxID=5963 RepID=A0A1R2C3D9_9CILI|nr:hypothetical protein SteCoe_15524 [Stentor coeruleus]